MRVCVYVAITLSVSTRFQLCNHTFVSGLNQPHLSSIYLITCSIQMLGFYSTKQFVCFFCVIVNLCRANSVTFLVLNSSLEILNFCFFLCGKLGHHVLSLCMYKKKLRMPLFMLTFKCVIRSN